MKRGRGRGERRAARPGQARPGRSRLSAPPPPEETPWLGGPGYPCPGGTPRPTPGGGPRSRVCAVVVVVVVGRGVGGGRAFAATRRDHPRFAGRSRPGRSVKAGQGPGPLPSAAGGRREPCGGRELRGKPPAPRQAGVRGGSAVSGCKAAGLGEPRCPQPPALPCPASRQLPSRQLG